MSRLGWWILWTLHKACSILSLQFRDWTGYDGENEDQLYLTFFSCLWWWFAHKWRILFSLQERLQLDHSLHNETHTQRTSVQAVQVIAELIETAALAELFMHTHKNTNNSNNKTVTTLQKSRITRHFFIFYFRWVRLSCNVFKCSWTMFLQTFFKVFQRFSLDNGCYFYTSFSIHST